jgi:hypothetical protein
MYIQICIVKCPNVQIIKDQNVKHGMIDNTISLPCSLMIDNTISLPCSLMIDNAISLPCSLMIDNTISLPCDPLVTQ